MGRKAVQKQEVKTEKTAAESAGECKLADQQEVTAAKKGLLGMIPSLMAHGIVKLTIAYDGAHDDGSITGAYAFKDGETDGKAVDLSETMELAAFNLVCAIHPGWELAEEYVIGGCGKVVLDARTKEIAVEHNYKIETLEFERTII